jgi:uncharacterized protein YjeT (DUF2065 family)
MNELAVLPAPRSDLSVSSELSERTEARVLAPARQRGYELRLVGGTVLPQRQVIARSQWGTWLFVDHAEDPTAREYGGKIPIPLVQHARLSDLAQAGVRPDVVWLAHELPAGWEEGEAIPQLVPAPAHLREKDQRLVQRLRALSDATLKAAGMTLAVAGAAASSLTVLGAGLDPIVLGGIKHPQYPVVEWVVLAQWEWE